MRIGFLFICGATLLTSTTSTLAGRADCEDAISSYNSAVTDISATLRRYNNCISASQGRDESWPRKFGQ